LNSLSPTDLEHEGVAETGFTENSSPVGETRRIDEYEAAALEYASSILDDYRSGSERAGEGRRSEAGRAYEELEQKAVAAGEVSLIARIANDRAVLAILDGRCNEAERRWADALAIDPTCLPARLNRDFLRATCEVKATPPRAGVEPAPIRVAILSFLFNWPSTGGGTVHTYELSKFLARAGYEVLHVYARFEPWGVGRVVGDLPYPSEALEFDEREWGPEAVRERFRRTLEAFDPDCVIVTDSWNIKPLLAEAAAGYPYVLRLQALECLCPLNNVRLLPRPGGFAQCSLNQLDDPAECSRCLMENGRFSGALHQAEREFCGVGGREYHESLLRAFAGAEAVLAVNPPTAAMIAPHARDVRVVTAGMDPTRFPWPPPMEPREPWAEGRCVVLFAGLAGEPMKGFHVLHEACCRLWGRRRDFALAATIDPSEEYGEFVHCIGWQSQDDLTRAFRTADVLAFPTIAQEALGRTAVEAMAAGLPVVASRIGGLPHTVQDGVSGLLCDPDDPDDLARKIEALLDDPAARARMGRAGRERFENDYSWDVIVERHYRPLLKRRDRAASPAASTAAAVDPRLGIPASFLEDRDEPEAIDLPGRIDALVRSSAPQYTLYRLVRRLRPRSVLEIGTQAGASAVACALAMRDAGADPDVVCVDPFRPTGDNAGLPTLVAWHEYVSQAGLLGRGVELIMAESRRALPALARKFDLILVDGSPAYEDVRGDLEASLDRLAPGGRIWVHDYAFHEAVRRAVDEVVAERGLPFGVNGVQRNARGDLCGWCLIRGPGDPAAADGARGGGECEGRPRLSVIVSVLDSHEVVRRQLLHLEEVLGPECELILVDDGSAPPLRGVCESARPTYRFTLHETRDRRPWTQPRGRNQGAALARAERLLFFDVDHILTGPLVETCLAYEGDKMHWVRRPGVLDANGRVVVDRDVLLEYGMTDDAPSVHVNSFLIRRDLFERLGGYDERFCGRYGGDDIDFNARYDRLCEGGEALPAEVRGEGYAYPDAGRDATRSFHGLPRVVGADLEAGAART
jgi:glycosyltransferase involved in cell wall biosynthesis/predicted O-methyltransferase YrrM